MNDQDSAPNLFLGSSTEARPVAECLASMLGSSMKCTPWWDVFRPSTFNLDELERAATSHRFAAFVGSAEDFTSTRGETFASARANVIGEFFLFVGRNGHQRTFLIVDSSAKLRLPSDLEGFVVSAYDGDLFSREPTKAVEEACLKIIERVFEIHKADAAEQRQRQERALTEARVLAADELADLAFVLRETVDVLHRDVAESLAGEENFNRARERVAQRVEEVCAGRLPQARVAGVEAELQSLQRSLVGIVQAIPFPRELREGVLDAQQFLHGSMLGLIPDLVEAVQARNFRAGVDVVARFRGRLTPEAVAQEIAALVESKLRALQDNYSQWWKVHASDVNKSLTRFQKALMHAQRRSTLRALRSQ